MPLPGVPCTPSLYSSGWEVSQTTPKEEAAWDCVRSPQSPALPGSGSWTPQTEDRPKGLLIAFPVVCGFVVIRFTIPCAWSEGFSCVYRVGQPSLQSRVEHSCHPRKKKEKHLYLPLSTPQIPTLTTTSLLSVYGNFQKCPVQLCICMSWFSPSRTDSGHHSAHLSLCPS